jgi:hypothetical protein
VSALTDAVPRSVNVEHYAKVVSDYANLREVERAFRRNFKALTETPAELRNGGGARLMESLGAVLSRANIQSETWASASLPELMAQMAEFPSRDPILGDLLALGEIAMFHGQPRDGKTWCSLESTVAVALGDAAFGLERFRAPRSAAVLIVSNEDSVSVYVSRLGMILAARGVKAPPENIRLIVGQGCDLDDPAWQRRVIDEAVRHGTKFLGGHPNPAIDRHLKTGHHS